MAVDPVPVPRLARRGMRVMARLVDVAVASWLVMFVLVEIIGRLFSGFENDIELLRNGQTPDTGLRVLVVFAVVVLATEILPTAFRGATVGKVMLGMRVVRDDTFETPGLIRSLLRWVVLFGALLASIGGWYLPLVLVLVVAAPMFVDALGKGFHDRAAGTIVIEVFERHGVRRGLPEG